MYAAEGMGAFYRGFTVRPCLGFLLPCRTHGSRVKATMIGAGPRGAMGFGVFETLKPAVGRFALFKDNPAAGKPRHSYD